MDAIAARRALALLPGRLLPLLVLVLAATLVSPSVSSAAAERTAFVAAPETTPSQPRPAAGPRTGLARQVFGFLPYWELADPSLRLRYGLLSTIAYFGVGVAPDGSLQRRDAAGKPTVGWAGWTGARMTAVVREAHRNRARVVLTLTMFAWTPGGAAAQARLLDDPAARRRLAREAAQAVRARGADGVNLDFEPLAAGHEAGFVALVRTLRTELDRSGRHLDLTFDTTGLIANYPVARATGRGAADAVLVMGYDYRTSDSSVAGSIAPLAGPRYDLADTLLSYLAVVPASRVILGIGWYGRAWPTVSADLNASTQTGARYGASVAVTYDAALGAARGRTVRWDAREATSWFAYRRQACSPTFGCVTTWRQVYYDDDRAMRLKYDLANLAGIRGVGIWALGYEGTHAEPWTAIADKFLRDTTAPRAGIRVLDAVQRDEGFLVDWSGWDDRSGVAGYDVQVSADGGPWRAWLTATRSGADVWLGRDGHAYAFRVRARDRSGNVGAWSTSSRSAPDVGLKPGGFARVLVDGLAARDRADPTGTRRDALAAGTVVAITDGPVTSGGVTWLGVDESAATWPPVSLVHRGVWIPVSSAGQPALLAIPSPDRTRVDAGLSGLSFGGVGAASIGAGTTAVARRSFSPDGDGTQDALRIEWHARVTFDSLTLRVLSSSGKLLGSRPVPARSAGDQSYAWDGSVGGRTLRDGRYLLQLVGTSGGTSYAAPSAQPSTPVQAAAYAVTIDTVGPARGLVSLTGRRLSPNGDGRHDSVVVAGTAAGADRWTFTAAPIVGGKVGAPVRSMAGTGASARVTWDGRADDGTVVPDGRYRLTIRNLDWAGNGPKAAWTVPVDTRAPLTTAAAAPALISPDGDGTADRAAIRWTSDEPASGALSIAGGGGSVRRFAIGPGSGGTVAWDGRDARGRLVPDGRYVASLELVDAAGNRAAKRVVVAVDRPVSGLAWSVSAFDPLDGDGRADTARLRARLGKSATVALRIEDARGALVRTIWSARARGAGDLAWTWDGRDGRHSLVPAGRYVAVLTVTTPLGTTELRRTIDVAAFAVSALPTSVAAGSFVTLFFRTVEPLRSIPTVTVVEGGATVSRARAVSAGGGRFIATVRIGRAGPVSIVIAARDAAGGTNVTRLSTRAR